MKILLRPVNTMAEIMYVRSPGGKLRARFSEDQFSRKSEQVRRIGRESRLL